MNYEDQLQRMTQNGVLTPEQAEKLRHTLGKDTNPISNASAIRLSKSLNLAIIFILLTLFGFFIYQVSIPATETIVENVSQSLNQPGELGAMNSLTSTIIAILIFLFLPLLLFVFSYNSIVSKEETVYQSWAQVESNYQRRADLVPNLVETVSRYLRHESETLENVTQARSQDFEAIIDSLVNAQSKAAELLSGSAVDPTSNESFLAEIDASQRLIGNQMSRLLATVESYPDLRSSEQMQQLQAQLEGTENRINIARIHFNDSVQTFNKSIRVLPGSLVARIGQFQRKAYFQSQAGNDQVPSVNFTND